jgi:hypothetical protein
MTKIANSLIALLVLGAMFIGTPGASYARERHAQGTAVKIHRPYVIYRSGYSQHPRAGYGWYGPPAYPNPYVRPFLTWDPYGVRWDGRE